MKLWVLNKLYFLRLLYIYIYVKNSSDFRNFPSLHVSVHTVNLLLLSSLQIVESLDLTYGPSLFVSKKNPNHAISTHFIFLQTLCIYLFIYYLFIFSFIYVMNIYTYERKVSNHLAGHTIFIYQRITKGW